MGPVSVPSAQRATSTFLAVFTWGRSVTPWAARRSRMRAQLHSILAASRRSDGVSSVSSMGLQEGCGLLAELCAEFRLAALRGVANVAGALEAAPARERILGDLAD